MIGPDIGTGAALFAAACIRVGSQPDRRQWRCGVSPPAGWGAEGLGRSDPDLDAYRHVDPRQLVGVLDRHPAVRASRLRSRGLPSSYDGDRFVESMRYVRSYPTDLAALRLLLPQIKTPVQIIGGGRDLVVPPANAEFLHERLPNSKLDLSTPVISPGKTPPTSTRRSPPPGGKEATRPSDQRGHASRARTVGKRPAAPSIRRTSDSDRQENPMSVEDITNTPTCRASPVRVSRVMWTAR